MAHLIPWWLPQNARIYRPRTHPLQNPICWFSCHSPGCKQMRSWKIPISLLSEFDFYKIWVFLPWWGVCIGNILIREKEKDNFPHLILYWNNVQQAPEWISRFFEELYAQFQLDLIVKCFKDIVPENGILLSLQLIKSTIARNVYTSRVHCLVKGKQEH